MSDARPDILRRAAQVLRHDGWSQGEYHHPSGSHCTVGALMVVTGGENNWVISSDAPELRVLADLIGIGDAPSPRGAITRWNDAEERTPNDVLLLLEQAAEKLEADQ